MSTSDKILAIYYSSYTHYRRIAVRTRVGYAHERIDVRRFETLKDMLVWLLRHLHEKDPSFLKKLADLDDKEFMNRAPRGRRKRRYLAPDRDTLYIQNPGLTDKYSLQIDSFWLATNIGGTEVAKIIKLAAAAADIALLSPLKIDLYEQPRK